MARGELAELAPGVLYFPGPINQLVLEDGRGGALIIDSGLDDDRAKKLLRALTARGLQPVALLNTHSHADHYGGNALLRARVPGLEVFAPPLEEAIIRHPLLEGLYLFGARPPASLQGKFLMGQASEVHGVLQPGRATVGGVALELIEVGGHACTMFAVRCGDVLFASDALFGPDTLEKHPLTFCVDSTRQKQSARTLQEQQGIRVVLPGHGEPTTDLNALVSANLTSFERTTEAVWQALAPEGSIDDLLARVCDALKVTMTIPAAVVLNRSVVSAHLVELLEGGRAQQTVEGNRWMWRRAP
ncbi:MBL fold metallo-hydrolase [Deinococcus peraridilitoris]|uniref:Zn-dependent hydrolase, glyoxylase n=1 Tax=Deinococcus peraridilitoris (strain DSM 19664 / LMG 22246 / CIP 109416 / KR-200) TaxID=937777 RepID=K9ZXK4_DEIPD|nr:MBL fold metallo-hydrolase [Deinococcus peraridilitoris]AFZ66398.1 Zn-dependent hydrolase, glyoxylase [Deinococcus peraridilitoris DSM 19664]